MAQKRKVAEDKGEEVQNIQQKFTKEQILISEKYLNQKDLVDALLDNKRTYNLGTVNKKLENYMKGKVK